MARDLTSILDRLIRVAKNHVIDSALPVHTEAERLNTILGCVWRHLPSFPRLECEYIPFHSENEEVLLEVLDRLNSVIIRSKPKNSRRDRRRDDTINCYFPADSVEIIRQITNDVAAILLQERMVGYIVVGLNRLRRLSAWVKSPFHSKTWGELDTILSSTETSPLDDVLSEVARKSGWSVSTIRECIHITSTSPLSEIEPFIISAITDRDIYSLSCRVSADGTFSEYLKNFYPAEKISPYNFAYQTFRNMWFQGPVGWGGYSLTSRASAWLEKHRKRPKKKGEKEIKVRYRLDFGEE